MDLFFASNNSHKKLEIQAILPMPFQIKGLADLGLSIDIEESGQTLEENALIKARTLHNLGYDICIADDTGLEIKALYGAPGVLSARYSGIHGDHLANMLKVLNELYDSDDREARFRTVIALIFQGKEYLFEGIINGDIANEMRGHNGFGYDPIFVPRGFKLSFGQLPLKQKLQMSHRSIALNNLVDFLKTVKINENGNS